jgi:hypothetical protein
MSVGVACSCGAHSVWVAGTAQLRRWISTTVHSSWLGALLYHSLCTVVALLAVRSSGQRVLDQRRALCCCCRVDCPAADRPACSSVCRLTSCSLCLGREVVASRADVVCLQEVDRAVFDGFLRPALLGAGYAAGFLLEKSAHFAEQVSASCRLSHSRSIKTLVDRSRSASSREGVAAFVRQKSGFRVEEYAEVSLGGGGASNAAQRSETDGGGAHEADRVAYSTE